MKCYYKNQLNLFYFLAFLCCSSKIQGQPTADFTASPLSGCAPLVVNFTDNSTGNPTSWNWNLGNGTNSSLKNPSTTYLNPGVYTVTLTVDNPSGSNTITKTEYIKVYGKPNVSFTVNDSADCVPFTCRFTDLSTTSLGAITSWQWNFDDGTNSTVQNPSHLFLRTRNYNISLKVTNTGGCFNVLNKLAYIKASDPLTLSFSFSQPVMCRPPETINFTNETHGPGVLNYRWSFGDGSTSATLSPSHTYTNGGTYSIKLFAENNLGCSDTLIYNDTLTIRNNQTVINGPDTVCIRKMISLTNASTPVPLTSRWLFDDNTTGFGVTIAKTWTTAGNHTVKLVTNFGACSDSIIKRISVLAPPTANFTSADTFSCSAPFTVQFTDASAGAIYWNWDFGDSTTAILKNPSHTYLNAGEYVVSLSVKNAPGCEHTFTKYRFIRVTPPTVNFDTKEGGGCIPYNFRPYPDITTIDGVASYLWDFGNGHTSTDRFPMEIYTDSGTYNVRLVVTTNDGCTESLTIDSAVRTGNRPHVDFNYSANEVCPRVDLQFTDLSAPVDKWKWQFGDGNSSLEKNPVHQYLDSGLLSVKLIAWNNGCPDSIMKPNIIRVLPGLSRFRPVFNCINKKEVYFKDSSITPETWLWDFGDGVTSTEQNPTHVFENYRNYLVKLTTTSGPCTNTDSVKVHIINETADFIAQKTTVCRTQRLIFFTNYKDNIAKYVWDFGDGIIDSILVNDTTSASDSTLHSYELPGDYTVSLTITDLNGCSSSLTKPNLIHVSNPHAAFSLSTAAGCTNKTVNFIDSSSGTIARRYWSFGDGSTRVYTAASPLLVPHTYTATGQYYPTLVITDSAGCIDSAFYTDPIGIYQPIADFNTPNYATCTNDSVKFQNASLGEQLVYYWSFGDGTYSDDSAAVKQYLAEGNFTPKLVVTDEFGCKDSLSRTDYINVKTVRASFSASDTVGLCVPFRVDFINTSVNATSSWWDFGDGGYSSYSDPLYYYSSPGTFYAKLTAKRSNNCISTDSVRLRINAPSGTLQYNSQSGCAPLTVHFNVITNDSVSFIWDFNDGTSFVSNNAVVDYTYYLPGNFVPLVVLKDSLGCAVPIYSTDTISLYNTIVNFGAVDTAMCNGDAVQFTDSSFSGSPVISRRWNFGDGSSSTEINPLHNYAAPGNYPVKLIITTRYGCQDSLVKNNYVNVYRKPEISISGNNASYCGPSVINFNGNQINNDSGNIHWEWDFGNGNISSQQNPPAQSYSDSGNYHVQLTASYNEGCADTAVTNISIKPLPNILAGNDMTVCTGSMVQLHATGANHYTWQPGAILSCTNCNSPLMTAQNDTYLYVTGRNNEGCEKTDSIFISVKKPFKLTVTNDTSICSGKNTRINISGAEKYSWTPSAGLSNPTVSDPIASPSATTTYKVVGTDTLNCFKDSATVTIQVYDQPNVNAGSDINLLVNNAVIIAPLYTGDISRYQWTPATGLNCADCPTPTASPKLNTTYKVEVINTGGCKATDEITIFVKCDNNVISMPTAFSPNDDGKNDRFYPLGSSSIRISSFKIFNRLGQMIFINGNFHVDDKSGGWDGRYKGEELPAGTYIYTIEFVCGNNEVSVVNGYVVLVR